jgi:ABC-type Fe3+ transport system permease subunit
MEQICTLLWGLIIACTPTAGVVLSWLMENWKWWQGWYKPLPDALKTVLFAVIAAAIGAGLGALGVYVLRCENWPEFQAILIMVAQAIIAAISGLLRYANLKLKEAKGKVKEASAACKCQ